MYGFGWSETYLFLYYFLEIDIQWVVTEAITNKVGLRSRPLVVRQLFIKGAISGYQSCGVVSEGCGDLGNASGQQHPIQPTQGCPKLFAYAHKCMAEGLSERQEVFTLILSYSHLLTNKAAYLYLLPMPGQVLEFMNTDYKDIFNFL